ncbi:hypothetical protein RJ639_044679 [Escallonia herrerae]|uniref:Carboxypeptidase n=1 Tax=Escallonia herrerae TaxID=1293975 RepID=A0AA88WCY1_9ASTE|nr:hypothetical protein RJ639_044679 [Escallonia herrerae]
MAAMENAAFLLYLSLLASTTLVHANFNVAARTDDGSEQWGYGEVRPKAHMFWWLYKSPYRVEDPSKPWPILLWLQGGPVRGFRSWVWEFCRNWTVGYKFGTSKLNLTQESRSLDSPVGTGFSCIEDDNLAVKTDVESATGLTTLLKELFNGNKSLQRSPLYIFAESYGGKFAVTLGVAALQAIEKGELKLQLGGVALGYSWISHEDYVFSWGPVLKTMSCLDDGGLNRSNSFAYLTEQDNPSCKSSVAQKIQLQLVDGQFEDATGSFFDLEQVIADGSNDVDFYNFMLDAGTEGLGVKGYSTYLTTKFSSVRGSSADLYSLMNGPIKKKLKIIPKNVSWGGQNIVFDALAGDFMRPRIAEVDELLAKGINVTVYNGHIDLICATKGTEAWMNKLKWDGLPNFLSTSRAPLYCRSDDIPTTKGFLASYKNLFFYWILGAGHFVSSSRTALRFSANGGQHYPIAEYFNLNFEKATEESSVKVDDQISL